ncbi:hypothetical protein BDA96_01G489800 [Sorghum bicolor]|uniref:Uncharacterized protein n=2 Tax=Sorghum bicolor TaxID=4558 RepID=A0A921S664_SORBI|nr:hypothetical protein BDA96_01G489800 [Sorghum bicolor]KXG39894.1 hypothetical protein SORBI_3001G459300 [Sorghum bicolor]
MWLILTSHRRSSTVFKKGECTWTEARNIAEQGQRHACMDRATEAASASLDSTE